MALSPASQKVQSMIAQIIMLHSKKFRCNFNTNATV